jgi:hypothetical protein
MAKSLLPLQLRRTSSWVGHLVMNEGGTFLDGIFDADRLTAKAKTKNFFSKNKKSPKGA